MPLLGRRIPASYDGDGNQNPWGGIGGENSGNPGAPVAPIAWPARDASHRPLQRPGHERGFRKSREEIEFDVADPEACVQVLGRLGYQPTFRYEKHRTTYTSPDVGGRITVDETPIGVFLELKGNQDWIDRVASAMGLSRAAYLTASYASLYREESFP